MLQERRREKDMLKAQEILLKRQKSGADSESDEEAKYGTLSFMQKKKKTMEKKCFQTSFTNFISNGRHKSFG